MTPERWLHIEAVFSKAADLDLTTRQAYLDSACAADPSLRRQVESMLLADREGGPLDAKLVDQIDLSAFCGDANPPLFLRRCLNCLNPSPDGKSCSHCGFTEDLIGGDPTHLPPHSLLLERYYIGRVLGRGGFGITYSAMDQVLGRNVAIKEYFPPACCSRLPGRTEVQPTSGQNVFGIETFLAEARVLVRMRHPNVVSVIDFHRANGTAYIVMEFVEGEDLTHYIVRRGGRLSFSDTLKILSDVMNALNEVHGHNLLHRDVSPDNIRVTPRGRAILLDFGAARFAIGERTMNLTSILKHGYAPEEQYRSGGQGPWTDVYAIAATFYHCITGEKPPMALDRRLQDSIVRPSTRCNDLPDGKDAVLLRALAFNATERYRTVLEFQKALSAPAVGRLYGPRAVASAVFLGSAAAGSVLVARNYRVLHRNSLARLTLGIGFSVSVVDFSALFLGYSNTFLLARMLLPFAAAWLVGQCQGRAIMEHRQKGGRPGSMWSAIGVGLLFFSLFWVMTGTLAVFGFISALFKLSRL